MYPETWRCQKCSMENANNPVCKYCGFNPQTKQEPQPQRVQKPVRNEIGELLRQLILLEQRKSEPKTVFKNYLLDVSKILVAMIVFLILIFIIYKISVNSLLPDLINVIITNVKSIWYS
jgi:hypothetical protein